MVMRTPADAWPHGFKNAREGRREYFVIQYIILLPFPVCSGLMSVRSVKSFKAASVRDVISHRMMVGGDHVGSLLSN